MRRLRAWLIRWAHKSEPKRLDRERMYLWIHAALPFVGMAIALRPAALGLPTISPDANRMLGLLIVWGSGLCLISASMGVARFLPDSTRDTRIPYGSGAFGQLSVVTSLTFYLWQIARITPLIPLMIVAVSFGIVGACLHITTVMAKEIWRIQHLKSHPDCAHWPKHADTV